MSLNTNDKKYLMVLKLAQDRLSDELGPEFYSEIAEQYDEVYHTFTADNEVLYEDHIRDFLAWQTYFYYLMFAQADATPTGIRQFNDANSNILEDVKLHSFEKNVRAQANYYRYKMVNFILEQQANDKTKYPLFKRGCAREENSFSITSVDKKSDILLQINKSIITNE